MSRKCRGLLVDSSASPRKGAWTVPHERRSRRRSRLVSADDGPGRQGDAEVAGNDRHIGQVPGLAEPAQLAAAAVYLVDAAHFTGRPAPSSRSAGRWPAAVSPGAPARGDGQQAPQTVLLPALRHEHIEVRPGLPGRGYHAENTVVTQFSKCPVHPACCGATHAVASPSRAGRSVDSDPGPDQVTGSQGSRPARGPAAPPAGPSSPSGRSGAGPASGTGSRARPPRQAPAVAFTPGASSRTNPARSRAAALRHHPPVPP